ncbi:lanosterol 14-alpha demethylase isoform X1 [Scyliorhinus canicula]|uniref:lanosterol 14-alpha demethylase isoform X1 n=1 Tax=Scyliorhinus canicula TaxID=7830 RepID=UPI0018F6EF35|nr:lanosterol 14-alpha demethylase isoform X1 [Scyliorhinus canicula]
MMLFLLEAGTSLLENAVESVVEGSLTSTVLVTSAFILSVAYFSKMTLKQGENQKELKYPPYIHSSIPFLGHAIAFGRSPIEFLENAYCKYGPVFSFTMVGKTFTYLLGSDSAALLFNSKNEDLNAEDVYSRLTTPVFGKGVAYDVPNSIFLEQKKMLKTGLNIAQFKQHISLIEEETHEYFKRWGDGGVKNLFEALSELIILTASHCLHGKEIRNLLNEKVAQLYADLDGGFTHAAWLLPGWLPLPSFRRRDKAHREIKNIFYKVIQKRRESVEKENDILQTLLDATYKDGIPLTDDEIAGLLIGLLLAGQHTSSTTSAWMGFFLSKDKELQERCYAEQKAVCGEDLPPLHYDQLKDMCLLDRCLKETLRLRPPIMTMMRMARTPQVCNKAKEIKGCNLMVTLCQIWRVPKRCAGESLLDVLRFDPRQHIRCGGGLLHISPSDSGGFGGRPLEGLDSDRPGRLMGATDDEIQPCSARCPFLPPPSECLMVPGLLHGMEMNSGGCTAT